VIGAPDETHRILTADGVLVRFGPHPIVYRPDGSVQQLVKGIWHLVDTEGRAYVKKNNVWLKNPSMDTTSETTDTYFINRKVTTRSDGVSFVEDGDNVTVSFPDGTKFSRKDKVFSHPALPDIQVAADQIGIDTPLFKAAFTKEKNCSVEMKNGDCSVTFTEEIKHLQIGFGQFRNVITVADLISGVVANVSARKCVYYLNDE
jgi:hypothetical protein